MSEPPPPPNNDGTAAGENPPGPPRGADGKFTPTPPATPPPKNDPPPPGETPSKGEIDATNRIAAKFADKLKAELGEKYSEKYDKMEVTQRIDAMEAAIDANKPKDKDLEKGEGQTPGPPPDIPTSPKTILEKQKEAGFKEKLRAAGSFQRIAEKLYKGK